MPSSDLDNQKHHFDKSIYKDFGSMGFLGSTIDGYGSSNSSKVSYGLIAAEFETIDSSYRSAISVQSSLVIHPIYYFGSEEQKNKYLPELINGNSVGCFGLTESEAGSDPGSMKTNFTEEKDCFIINGTKNWITNAPIADIFIIWALDKKKNIKGFIIEKNTPGISTSLIKNKASLKISPTGQIILNNVKIPKNNILPNTQGWKSVFSCLNTRRRVRPDLCPRAVPKRGRSSPPPSAGWPCPTQPLLHSGHGRAGGSGLTAPRSKLPPADR